MKTLGPVEVLTRLVVIPLLILAAAIAQEAPQNAPNTDDSGPGHMSHVLPFTSVRLPEVLSDSMGYDFAPYLRESVVLPIRANWHFMAKRKRLATTVVRNVVTEFTIVKDGSLQDLKLADGSGDPDVDQTAMDAISHSAPYAALPAEFKGTSVRLRCTMALSSPAAMKGGPPQTESETGPNGEMIYKAGNGVAAPRVIHMTGAEFSEEARRKKVQGVVVLSMIVTADGTATDIKVVRPLGSGLDEKAIEAVKQWTFAPGTKDGTPVAVRLAVEIDFHLMKQ